MRLSPAIPVLLLALLAPAAHADRVHLKGGGVLEGEAERGPNGWRVRLPGGGEATFPEADVERVEEGGTARDEAEARRRDLDPTDVEGWYRLGLFCQGAGLKREAEEALRHALALTPGHEAAHAALGEVFYDGRWMPQEAALAAQGQVRLGGRWVTPAERDRILKAERQRWWSKELGRLAKRVRSPSWETADEAAWALASIADPDALPALLEYARHFHPAVRAPLARSLCNFGGEPRAEAALAFAATRDETLVVSDAAIASLAEARIEGVGARLLEDYLESDEAWVRKAAAYALGKIRFKPAFPALVATLYFHIQHEALVPAEAPGSTVAVVPGRRRLVLRTYNVQALEYRIVDDYAFNDAARVALCDLTGRNFDFDRGEWIAWWRENEAKVDLWMRPAPAK